MPPLLQIVLWEHIFNLPADRDYLQVFLLTEEGGKQKIKHTQEEPEYCKESVYEIGNPITAKIFVIDDGTHSTMLLAEEY